MSSPEPRRATPRTAPPTCLRTQGGRSNGTRSNRSVERLWISGGRQPSEQGSRDAKGAHEVIDAFERQLRCEGIFGRFGRGPAPPPNFSEGEGASRLPPRSSAGLARRDSALRGEEGPKPPSSHGGRALFRGFRAGSAPRGWRGERGRPSRGCPACASSVCGESLRSSR